MAGVTIIQDDDNVRIYIDDNGELSDNGDIPAIFWKKDGISEYFKAGIRHRLNGAAYEKADKSGEWFINGCYIPHIYEWAKENDVDLTNITDDDMVLIMFTFGK